MISYSPRDSQEVFPTNTVQKHRFFSTQLSFLGGSEGKESACNAGDLGSIPGLGRFPGEGNGNALQYSCLENSMDEGACRNTARGIAKSRKRLSNFISAFFIVQLSHPYMLLLLSRFSRCLTLCNPKDGSPPGSPIPGILQARTLEWVAISFSNPAPTV